jgi:anti-anti-sigma factor
MNTLSLQFDRRPGQVIFTLCGSLDGSSSSAFNAFVAEHLVDEDPHIALDCAGLTYISSAGLREFLMLAKRVARFGHKPIIAGAGGAVALALEIAGFNALFTLVHCLPGAEHSPGLLERLFGKTGRV